VPGLGASHDVRPEGDLNKKTALCARLETAEKPTPLSTELGYCIRNLGSEYLSINYGIAYTACR